MVSVDHLWIATYTSVEVIFFCSEFRSLMFLLWRCLSTLLFLTGSSGSSISCRSDLAVSSWLSRAWSPSPMARDTSFFSSHEAYSPLVGVDVWGNGSGQVKDSGQREVQLKCQILAEDRRKLKMSFTGRTWNVLWFIWYAWYILLARGRAIKAEILYKYNELFRSTDDFQMHRKPRLKRQHQAWWS